MTHDEMRERIKITTQELLRACSQGTPPKVTNEHAIVIASSFISQAAGIFITLGGRNLAAQQFYAVADMFAAPEDVKP